MAKFGEGFGSIWKLLGKDLEALLDASLLVVSEASLGSLGYFGYVLGYVVVPGKV